MKKRISTIKYNGPRRELSFFLVFLLAVFLIVFFSIFNVLIKESSEKAITFGPYAADIKVPGITTGNFDVAVDKRNGNIHIVYQDNVTKIYNRIIFDGNSWGVPEQIPGINTKDKNPRIAVDGFGNTHVVFERQGQNIIAYARSNSGSWVVNDISQSTAPLDGINDGVLILPQIAIDSKNNVHVAAFLIPPDPAYPITTPFFYISKARYMLSKYNGAGWDAFTTEDKEYGTSSTSKKNGAHPAITVDKNDNLHMVYMASPWAIMVHEVRSPNGIWSTPEIVQCTNKQCPQSNDALKQGDGVGDFLDVAVDNNGIIYVSGQWTRAYDSSSGYSENYIALWSNNGKGSYSGGDGNWKRWRAYRQYWDPLSDVAVDNQGNVYMVWALPKLPADVWMDWSSTIPEIAPACNTGETLVDRKAHYMIFNSSSGQWITPNNDPCPPTISDVLPDSGTRHRYSGDRDFPRLAVTSSGVWAFWIDVDDRLQLYMTKLSGQQQTTAICKDTDLDGYKDLNCGGNDCNDLDGNIHPGATEICGDNIDNDCVGGDAICQAAGWRSKMFPENWQPIDKIGAAEGVNIFTDPEGTKDPNGNTVTSGPNYHPYRFLHDFSYAGYHAGEKPIPPEDPNGWTKTAKVYNVVTQYGCTPDGKIDCRAAIQAAIDAAGKTSAGGIIYLPAGEYRITAKDNNYFLKIRNNSIVIRGDGPDKTKIKVDPYFNGVFDMASKHIFDIDYKDGNLNVLWDTKLSSTASITKDLPIPTKVIPVSNAGQFKVGDTILIQGFYTTSSLREHDMENIWAVGDKIYEWRRTVTAVDTQKNEINIDVPTRYRISVVADNPKVSKIPNGLSEIGLEHFSIGMIRHPDEWPDNEVSTDPIVSAIKGNMIMYLSNVYNSWFYDLQSYRPSENAGRPTDDIKYGLYEVEILNGVFYLIDSQFVTIKNFYFKNMQVDGNPGGGYGYAIQLYKTNEVLVENGALQKIKKGFAFNNAGTSGNVIKDVTVKEVFTTQNDFHSYLSTSNLIDNNDLQGTYWEAAIRPIDLLSIVGGTNHGHGTTQSVFWNTKGAPLTIDVFDWWDRDNNNDGKRDELNGGQAILDPGIIVSNQFGWGYIIGTYGSFSDVITAKMADRIADLNNDGKDYNDDPYRPYILPRDYKEGIGYDKSSSPYYGKALCPRSLYEAQLQLRLTGKIDTCSIASPICKDTDLDGYKDLNCGGNDCNDLDGNIHPGATEICGDGKDNDCVGGDAICSNSNMIVIDNLDSGFSSIGNWQISKATNPYGSDSLYSAILGDSATWTSSLAPGVYDAYTWWTYLPSRSQSAPYSIYNGNSLLKTVRVNQNNSALAGIWNLLGEYSFDNPAKIILKVEGGASYSADAVSFIKVRDITSNCVPSVEICNGKDDDCDGLIDEGVTVSFYKDSDGDTYGDSAGTSIQTCLNNPPQGYVLNNLDCKDNDNSLNLLKQCSFDGNMCGNYQLCVKECPIRNEICGNNIDEDCDGSDLQCSSGKPLLSVFAPQEKTYKNKIVPVNYSASQASNCGYYLNAGIKNTACNVDTYLKLGTGKYSIDIFANNSFDTVKIERNFTVIASRRYQVLGNRYIESGSLGSLDDYTDEQLEKISSFSIELAGVGKIQFLETVNLTKDANQITDIIDIDHNVFIDFNKIKLDPNVLSSLNKKARITLEELEFDQPIILKDGVPCDDCVIKNYSNGVLVFDVAGFSTYSVKDASLNSGNNNGKGIDNSEGSSSDYSDYNISSLKNLQRIDVGKEPKFFITKNYEHIILNIENKEYDVSFELEGDTVILSIGGLKYYIALGKSIAVALEKINLYSTNEPNIYLGVKEVYPGSATIAVGLIEKTVKANVEKPSTTAGDTGKSKSYILIFGLIAVAAIIAVIIIALLSINNKINIFKFGKNRSIGTQDKWTGERRFVIKRLKDSEK